MSMSTHVVGLVPPDEKWKKMKAVYDSCRAAELPIPDEVEKFFDHEDPDPMGVAIAIPCQEYKGYAQQGVEVLVENIPKHVKAIRFYNSY